MYAPRGEGGQSLLYIFIAYCMQKGGGGRDSIKNAYVINGRPLCDLIYDAHGHVKGQGSSLIILICN